MVSYNDGYRVFLDIAARGDNQDFNVNRILLNCNTVAITTGKTVMAFPVPFSGLVTGESAIASLDLGMAEKTIQLNGTIFEDTIKKVFDTDDVTNYPDGIITKTRKMTAQEICQLIHSYVDSSVLQEHQNLNKLTILIPSRVDSDFDYYTVTSTSTSSETEDLNLLHTIPFNYKVRALDNKGGLGGIQTNLPGSFPDNSNTGTTSEGLQGFIRSFNTTFTGESNFIEFSLDFQIATMSL